MKEFVDHITPCIVYGIRINITCYDKGSHFNAIVVGIWMLHYTIHIPDFLFQLLSCHTQIYIMGLSMELSMDSSYL